jgi:hypothetical protein
MHVHDPKATDSFADVTAWSYTIVPDRGASNRQNDPGLTTVPMILVPYIRNKNLSGGGDSAMSSNVTP